MTDPFPAPLPAPTSRRSRLPSPCATAGAAAATTFSGLQLADTLRLDKGGFTYWWRSHPDPPWNHHVREPVQFWSSQHGPDHAVLRALAELGLHDLPRPMPSPPKATVVMSSSIRWPG